MLKFIFLSLAFVSCTQMAAWSQTTGIYEATVAIDGSLYTEPSGNTFHNNSIQRSAGQKLFLTTVYVKTSGRVNEFCRAFMYYRVYEQGSQPGNFNVITCDLGNEINNANDTLQNQQWMNNSLHLNLIDSLPVGVYTIELYYAARSAIPGTGHCNLPPNLFLDNAGENFKANVTVTSPLNMEFTGFGVKTNNEKVFLFWEVDRVNELQSFVLEKSHNGAVWTVMDTVQPQGLSYQYTENIPIIGVNFYRIKAVGIGKLYYSNSRRIYVGRVDNSIPVYPNPVIRNLRFHMTAMAKGKYDLTVYHSDGTRWLYKTIYHDGTDQYITVKLPSNITKGIYRLILTRNNEFFKQNFLVQ